MVGMRDRRVFHPRRALTFWPYSPSPRACHFLVAYFLLMTLSPSSYHRHHASQKAPDKQDELTERIDWVMQESTLEGMHPWASAMFAHNSYFSNIDLMTFLLNRLGEAQEEEGRGGGQEGTDEVVESGGGT